MPDLLEHINVPALLKDMAEMGAILPAGIEVSLERHLRVFAVRYVPPKEKKWRHKTLKTVPNTVRRFFSKPRYEEGSYFFRYDKHFLCGWRKGVMQRPKSVFTGAADQMRYLVNKVENAIIAQQCSRYAPVQSLIRIIPKTKKMRQGAYSYIEVPFYEADGEPTYSPTRRHDHNHGYLAGYYGRDLLHIFKDHPGSLVKITNIETHNELDLLLLHNDKFFLVGLG